MRICTLCLQNYSKYIITFEDNSEKYFLGIVAKKILSVFFVREAQKRRVYIFTSSLLLRQFFFVCVCEKHTHTQKRIYIFASSFHLTHETLEKSSGKI